MKEMEMKKKEQKRRPKPKDGSTLACMVCGDKALGYNFDAITCESCKAFFRRNARKIKTITCSFDGNCKLDPHTRKFCSGCRLRKCFEVGMRKDWILDDDQLAKRRRRLREKSVMESNFSELSVSSGLPGDVSTTYTSDEAQSPSLSSTLSLSPDSGLPTTSASIKSEVDLEDMSSSIPMDPTTRQQLLDMEAMYTSIFDAPYAGFSAMKLHQNPSSSNDIFNLTDVFVRRLIKFAKCLPEFKMLPQEDQIHLLKGGIMEIFVLRSAMGFDSQEGKWKFKDSMGKANLDPSIIADTLGTAMFSNHVRFLLSIKELTRGDRLILLLLFIIELFSSDRPNLTNKEMVSKSQEKYSEWLKMYLESIFPPIHARGLYPRLLMKLLDVRNLGEASAQLASQLDITRMEPLLVEVFNLKK